MARAFRLEYSGALYHITSRGDRRVGITRAKTHTLIVGPAYPEYPILKGHKLS